MLITFLLVNIPVMVFAQWETNNNGGPIVHMFEWKWADIATECETFLSIHGFGGVQVSPPSECAAVYEDNGKPVNRPWWERYQPVSYILDSRSGNAADFQDMVDRCNAAGIRIYVDGVLNHMTGGQPAGTGTTGSSTFDAGSESYPAVPYSYLDFNDDRCESDDGDIDNYQDADEVRLCKLEGLKDLDGGTEYVRGKIRDYLNSLISMGVAGFRLDGCKHMYPEDLYAMTSNLDNLRSDIFGEDVRPFIVQEVIDNGGEPITANQYFGNGRVTEFKYSSSIGEVFQGQNGQLLSYLENFGEGEDGWGFMEDGMALVFVDNHDNERGDDTRILTASQPKLYKMAVGFTMAWDYGIDRLISSYEFSSRDQGPPQDASNNIVSPTINDDDSCSGGWICQHRWRQIYNMARFSFLVQGTTVDNWWDNESNMIAFSRGDVGFAAFNHEGTDMTETLQTGMSAGTYCDIISGNKVDGACTGKTVTVNADGTAYIEILNSEDDGLLAFHTESML